MNSKQKVAIVGLGYVGLPLALRCQEKGYQVFGVDLDKKKVAKIQKGESPLKEDFIEDRLPLLKKLSVSFKGDAIADSDIVVVCVPTPVDDQFFPDFGPIRSAIKLIIDHHRPGQLVIIESTINPGVCEEIIEPLFAENDLKEDRDHYLAHCPERIDPGNEKWNVGNIPRVVGALSTKGLEKAKKFYDSIIDGEIRPMKTIRAAEAVKVVENSFRDINIAFVNELAQSFHQMDIDVKDVIDGASTKPFAFLAHYPGRGVGGHCIPVDPYYLIEQAKKKGFDHKLLRAARTINNFMPVYTVELMQDLLNKLEMPMKNTSIGVMGLSYKANIDDLRESPALKIIKTLKKKYAKVVTYDPYVPGMSDEKNLSDFLDQVKAVVLVTNHREFLEINPETYRKHGVKAIVDGMNCLDHEKIKAQGVEYAGIGRK